MSIQLCLYGTRGSISQDHYEEYLSRTRTDDDKPLVRRLVITTTNDGTVPMLRKRYPHLDIVAGCDPGTVMCITRGAGETLEYDRPSPGIDQPGRLNSNPDMNVTQAVADHIRGGFPDAYWRNPDGTIAVPQTNDAQWHPVGTNLWYNGQMRNVLEVWGIEAKRLSEEGPQYSAFMADCHAGTWLSYGGKWREMGLGLEEWRNIWDTAVRGIRSAGIKLYENCYGPGGPRDSNDCDGHKVENMFRQGGTRERYAWWGYVACTVAYGQYRSGLPLITKEKAAESIMTINPKDGSGNEEQFNLLRACLVAAQMFNIGYVSMQETWLGEWWDAHRKWRDEVELLTRLEPVNGTEWHRWSHADEYNTDTLPDAPECEAMEDLYGLRDMRDPIGGQHYKIWLNPNDHQVGYTNARSAKYVMK